MLYTEKVRAAVRSIPRPDQFRMDVFEYNLNPPFIALRFYHTQWEHYSENERYKATMYLIQVKKVIESFGIRVTLEPIDDRVKGMVR